MTEQPTADQPWRPPVQGYPHQDYPGLPERPATSKAVLALVLGVLGLTACPGVASIPAWIVGHEAVKEIDASGGTLGGRSLAFAGKVAGILGTVLGALGVLAIAAVLALSGIFVSSIEDCLEDGGPDYSATCP